MFGSNRSSQGRQRPAVPLKKARSFSYYGGMTGERSSRPPEKTVYLANVGHKLRLLPSITAVSIIALSLLFSLTLSSHPSVSTLGDEPSLYRPLEEYAAAAEELIGSAPGNHLKLTIDVRKIEQSLIERYPELSAAKLRLPVLGRKPNLVIDVSPPALLLTGSSKVYVLDSSGTVVSEASNLPSEARTGLTIVKDQSGLDIEIGKQAVTSDTIGFIKIIKGQLEAKQLKILELTLPALANELDIRIDGLSYFIKTDVAGDARKQIGSFLAVKSNLESKRITPSEYIDVRAGEKVFYK
jgi:hypothetical protein